MEHRFIGTPVQNSSGEYEIDGHDFANRFRYRLTLRRDISENWFAHVCDEIWFHQDGLKPESFDRNWLYVGVGYRVASSANIQLGYLHQWIRSNTEKYFERPTLQFMLQYDF